MSDARRKVALVTGAARGIGFATAKRFLAEGWRVALLDIDGETLKRANTLLPADATLAIQCDVSDAAGVRDALARIANEFGRQALPLRSWRKEVGLSLSHQLAGSPASLCSRSAIRGLPLKFEGEDDVARPKHTSAPARNCRGTHRCMRQTRGLLAATDAGRTRLLQIRSSVLFTTQRRRLVMPHALHAGPHV